MAFPVGLILAFSYNLEGRQQSNGGGEIVSKLAGYRGKEEGGGEKEPQAMGLTKR